MYGTPQTKPEERNRYLGSLRERIYLEMTVKEIKDKALFPYFLKELAKYPGQQVLINGNLANFDRTPYLTALTKANLSFTVIDNDYARDLPEAAGLLIINKASEAVNEPKISLTEKYPQITKPIIEKEASKPGLFKKLFE